MKSAVPVCWGDEWYVACGRCSDCKQAVKQYDDLLLVAGMRLSQRKLLRDAGARTIHDLAAMNGPPEGMVRATFDRLVAQARLQVRQLQASRSAPEAEPVVLHELGHLAGLAHVDDPTQVMNPRSGEGSPTTYAGGDLRGLATAGAGTCR